MRWQTFPVLAASLPFVAFAGHVAADTPRISSPAIHDNLAIYFIHGTSTPGPTPLTLNEAMASGAAVVHETGNVNTLAIENTGNNEVFVQAGDIVKGGQQDRVLTVSFLVPARSGRIDIAAYCVEQGRWSARGGEDVKRFASSEKALPSREAKLAMLTPSKAAVAPAAPAGGAAAVDQMAQIQTRTANRTINHTSEPSRQSEMWSNVAKAQRKLSDNLGAPVAAAASASSLQLALENKHLEQARRAYVTALSSAAAGKDDIVGFVFAVGGKLNSGDVYASNALFKKMWAKQLEAAVTEAIAEKTATATTVPGIEDVRAFMARAESGVKAETTLPASAIVRETRQADTALLTETRRPAGSILHRSYVAF